MLSGTHWGGTFKRPLPQAPLAGLHHHAHNGPQRFERDGLGYMYVRVLKQSRWAQYFREHSCAHLLGFWHAVLLVAGSLGPQDRKGVEMLVKRVCKRFDMSRSCPCSIKVCTASPLSTRRP